MSDDTQTPTSTPDVATPAPSQPAPSQPAPSQPAPKDDRALAWEKERASLIDQLTGTQGQLATALKERDQLKAQFAEVEPKAKEADTLRLKVEDYVRKERESAIIGKLRNALPHATEFEIRGALAGLHEAGKVDRYSDKPDDAAKTALDLLKTEAPSLTRPPTTGGGTNGVRVGPSATRHPSLVG